MTTQPKFRVEMREGLILDPRIEAAAAELGAAIQKIADLLCDATIGQEGANVLFEAPLSAAAGLHAVVLPNRARRKKIAARFEALLQEATERQRLLQAAPAGST